MSFGLAAHWVFIPLVLIMSTYGKYTFKSTIYYEKDSKINSLQFYHVPQKDSYYAGSQLIDFS